MDAKHFDRLARAFVAASTRRGLLHVLSTLPIVGGLASLFAAEDGDAKGRRKRRKKRHKHGKGRRRKHQKKCKPNSLAKTCTNTCGPVQNNCKKTVDCGSCACDQPCDVCFTCQDGPNTPGACVVDPDQQGQTCGDPGQVCLADGNCACDDTSCAAGQRCLAEECVCDAESCASGCCDDAETCHIQDDDACGTEGGICLDCTANDLACVEGDCICTAGSCPDGCCQGGSCQIDEDAACGTSCVDCGAGRRCVNGACVCDATSCPAGCCDAQGQCQVDNDLACGTGGLACTVGCADNQVCRGGACLSCRAACPGPSCQFCVRDETGHSRCSAFGLSGSCGSCTSSNECRQGQICVVTLMRINGQTEPGGLPCGRLGAVCYFTNPCGS